MISWAIIEILTELIKRRQKAIRVFFNIFLDYSVFFPLKYVVPTIDMAGGIFVELSQ